VTSAAHDDAAERTVLDFLSTLAGHGIELRAPTDSDVVNFEVAVPPILAAWWRHVGSQVHPDGQIPPRRRLGGAWWLFSQKEALHHSRKAASTLARHRAKDPTVPLPEWGSTWIAVARAGNSDLLISDMGELSAPMHYLAWEEPDLLVGGLPSFAALLEAWTQALLQEFWRFDPRQDRWLLGDWPTDQPVELRWYL